MHPGAIAALLPDKPAVIMASSGKVVTYRELDEESNRLAQLFRAAGLRPGDHIAFMLENHPLFLAVALGRAALGPVLHGDQLAAADRRARLHRRRLRGPGLRLLACPGATWPPIADLTPKVELRLMVDGVAAASTPTRRRSAAIPADAHRGRVPGRGHALLLRHHRPAQGRQAAAAESAVDTPRRCPRLVELLFGFDDDSVYLSPAPLYHAAPLRFSHGRPAPRRDGRGDGAFDAERRARLHRALPGHPQPVGADHVRAAC